MENGETGKPKVTKIGRHYEVDHGDGRKTKSQNPYDETVLLERDGRIVEVMVRDVWDLHGGPCKKRSRRYGGKG